MKVTRLLTFLIMIALMPSTLFASHIRYVEKICPLNNPYHLLVNKQQPLTEDFTPESLVVPNVPFTFNGFHEKKQMEATAAKALEDLFAGAKEDGITLAAVSGYRSFTRQAQLYKQYVKRDGQLKADTYSARPGSSEHQTGLAIDISAPSVNYHLSTALGGTLEGQWIEHNAHLYGFVLRYPKNKEHLTGYMYEPWHIRYVGKTLAYLLYTNDLTLEELDTCCPTFQDAIIPQHNSQQPSKKPKIASYHGFLTFDLSGLLSHNALFFLI